MKRMRYSTGRESRLRHSTGVELETQRLEGRKPTIKYSTGRGSRVKHSTGTDWRTEDGYVCPHCHGTGEKPKGVKCTLCEGKGMIWPQRK